MSSWMARDEYGDGAVTAVIEAANLLEGLGGENVARLTEQVGEHLRLTAGLTKFERCPLGTSLDAIALLVTSAVVVGRTSAKNGESATSLNARLIKAV